VIRGTLVLVEHSLHRIRAVLVGLGLLLAGFQFLLTQIAAYLLRTSAFGQLSMLVPDFIRSLAGPSTLAFMSFAGIVGFGYFHPIVIAAVVALMIAIATEPAAEVETRFVDLTLARPLTRTNVITRTLLVLAVAGFTVLGLMMGGTWTGLACCTPVDAPRPSPRLIAALAISLAAIMVCWAGVTLAIAAAARRRAAAGAVAGVCTLAAYLLDYVGRAWEPARAASVLSPFHYFEPMSLVAGQPLSAGDLSVLVGIGTISTAVAYIVFARRDI
jgi:ABC-type transport system involved in multi-copper enzyme maturation permease subunit